MSDAAPSPSPRCSRCGGETRGGLCPACLLAAAAESVADFSGAMMTQDASLTSWSAAPGADARLFAGQDFGPYRIVRLLGRGGMGDVYEAEQTEQGRRVALKVLSERLTEPHDRARFLREGQLAASIVHPNIVYIFGSEEIAGTPVIAMELLAGGTLNDRVREQGPLSAADAVDAILQIIAGLDAARAVGILHRDIKPANCFIDRDGTVKVGDFGLSISTMARDVTELAKTGTVAGTPQFAAPEQLKGDRLDVRTDIYGVGATLYYLLTGQPPFDHHDLLVLVTRVATDAPRSPHEIVRAVPHRLAAIVLRCLSKDPTARPPTYAALNEALRPFGSSVAVATPIASRFAAGAIDQVIALSLHIAILSLIRISGVTVWRMDWTPLRSALFLGAYFALTEGLTGTSAGKWILGLRVTDIHGGKPGLVRALARSTLFVIASRGPFLIPIPITVFLVGYPQSSFLLRSLGFLALFPTVRKRHDFEGIHDLVTGTRVTNDMPEARAGMWSNIHSVHAAKNPAQPNASGLAKRGPFLLLESLSSAGSGPLWLAYDPTLQRNVWIREAPVGAPLSDGARRDLARPRRLRWLAGRREADGTWEAFEAPPGTSLLRLAATKQPWAVVRQWLADLAEELMLCRRDGHVPMLGLDRVWITTEGRATLLDFPAPGPEARETIAGIAETQSISSSVHAFLGDVAWSALLGRVQSATNEVPMPQPPLPPSGITLLRALREPGFARAEDLPDLCGRALKAPLHVSRWSRALLPACIVTSVCAVTLAIFQPYIGSERRFQIYGRTAAIMNSLVAVERLRRSGAPSSDPERRALEIYIISQSHGFKLPAPMWPYQRLANDIGTRRPAVSDAELLTAMEQLGPDRLDDLNRRSPIAGVGALLLVPLWLLRDMNQLLFLSLLFAFALRGGLVIRLFGLALVDAAGSEVTRRRALWRAAVAWMPLMSLSLLANRMAMALSLYSASTWIMVGALCLVIAIWICWSIVVPERGLEDRIAGTWLVPR